MIFLWSSYSIRGLNPSSYSPIESPQALSTFWLWWSAPVLVSCLVEPLRGQPSSDCKHGMGLKLGQWLVGHSSVSAPASRPTFLADRINFGSKVLWVHWCPLGFLPSILHWSEWQRWKTQVTVLAGKQGDHSSTGGGSINLHNYFGKSIWWFLRRYSKIQQDTCSTML